MTRVRASAVGPGPDRRVEEALARFAGIRRPVLVPEDREACDAAMLAGRSLTEHVPRSPARLAVAGLAREVAGVAAPRRRTSRRGVLDGLSLGSRSLRGKLYEGEPIGGGTAPAVWNRRHADLLTGVPDPGQRSS